MMFFIQNKGLRNALKPLYLLTFFGGARQDRTADLLRATQALSQLSYSPKKTSYFFYNFKDYIVD